MTSTTPTTLTPAATRILAAAGELFYDRGIGAVGVELLAERAGTTKKTLYDRFGSKEGIVVAYLEARYRRWQEHVTAHLDAAGATGADAPLAVLDALESWMVDSQRGCGFVNAYAELSGTDHAGTRCVRAEKQWVRELYERLARDAGCAGPADLGRRLALVHEGAIVAQTAGGSLDAIDDARVTMRRLLTSAEPVTNDRE